MKKKIYVIHSVEIEFDETRISENDAISAISDNTYFPCEDTDLVSITNQERLFDTKEACETILCEEHEIMRHFWCKDDIRGLETGGREFTEDEVDAIFAEAEARVDCEYGVNWQYLDDIAYEVAPDAYAECAEADENEQ